MREPRNVGTKRLFEHILDKYKTAWEQRDPDLAVELFTEDSTYQEDPFDPAPMRGRSEIYRYWSMVPRFQKDIRFSHAPVLQLAGTRVWGAEWAAKYTKVRIGRRMTLRGVLFCELSGRRIRRFWEYWHLRGGTPSFLAKKVPSAGSSMRRKERPLRNKAAEET